tara:strand:+ start:122 stop:1381 length:1260 start_codon:yes stop_codon:yes gene_type:complete
MKMINENIFSLIVFLTASFLYMFTTITLASFIVRSTLVPRDQSQGSNVQEDLKDNRMSLGASAFARFIQLSSVLFITANMFMILDVFFGNFDLGQYLVFSIVASSLFIIILHILCSLFVATSKPVARKVFGWYRAILETLSTFPIINWFIGFSINLGNNGQKDKDADMNATLQESLDYLEEAVIPEEAEELRMIRGVLRMDSVRVREIMVPRVDIVSISGNASIAEVADLMKAEGGHSKIPIFGESMDDIIGIAYARDILAALDENVSPESGVKNLVRKSLHVPESQSLEKFLRGIQEQSTSVAMVVDEYGGISGLVTVTDLIEEIVGELTDEFDKVVPEIERINEREILADAGVSIDSLNQTIGTSINANGFDTVGGLVMKASGKVPSVGDEIHVNGLLITIQSIEGRRVQKVKIVTP